MIEKLTTEGMFGPEGREKQLERQTREHLERLARKHPGLISEVDGIGAMIAFRLGDGELARTRDFIQRCFDAGLVLCRVGGGALARWPPSAAQTVHAVFPHTAFPKTQFL